jgi:predicted AlkP superfamily phosphohydrolase/phosphomutase
VFINLKGREPQGIVEPEAYEALREAIAEGMLGIVDPDDGLPVVDQVYRKEALFHGRYLDEAPDLLAIMRGLSYITRKGYEFAGRRGELFRPPYTEETGSHRLEGIIAAAGPDIAAGALPESAIEDLTPTLLYLQGCPIPSYMDGQVITPAIAPAFAAAHAPAVVERAIDDNQPSAAGWDAAAEADVTERLKQLGYLG